MVTDVCSDTTKKLIALIARLFDLFYGSKIETEGIQSIDDLMGRASVATKAFHTKSPLAGLDVEYCQMDQDRVYFSIMNADHGGHCHSTINVNTQTGVVIFNTICSSGTLSGYFLFRLQFDYAASRLTSCHICKRPGIRLPEYHPHFRLFHLLLSAIPDWADMMIGAFNETSDETRQIFVIILEMREYVERCLGSESVLRPLLTCDCSPEILETRNLRTMYHAITLKEGGVGNPILCIAGGHYKTRVDVQEEIYTRKSDINLPALRKSVSDDVSWDAFGHPWKVSIRRIASACLSATRHPLPLTARDIREWLETNEELQKLMPDPIFLTHNT